MKSNFQDRGSIHGQGYNNQGRGRGGQGHGRGYSQQSGFSGQRRDYGRDYNNSNGSNYRQRHSDGFINQPREKRGRDEDFDGNDFKRASLDGALPTFPKREIKKAFRPGGQVEHQEIILDPHVVIVKEILTRLCDFSSFVPEDDIISNIQGAANVLSSNQDFIESHPEEIAELFVKSISTLSAQIPIIATTLSLIHQSSDSFTTLVVSLIQTHLVNSLSKDDVITSKLALRALAVLASGNCIAIDGEFGFLALLTLLLKNSSESCVVKNTSESSGESVIDMSSEGKVLTYLLAETLPWIAPALLGSLEGSEFLQLTKDHFDQVLMGYRSCYDINGKQSLFHAYYQVPDPESEADIGFHVLSSGPADVCCWDTLWEAVNTALAIVRTVLDGESFTYPPCMMAFWVDLGDLLITDKEKLTLRETLASELQSLVSSGQLVVKEVCGSPIGSSLGSGSTAWLSPRFAVYDLSAFQAETPPQCFLLKSLEKTILTGYYRDILHFFEPIMNEDGTRMGSIDLLCNHLFALERVVQNPPNYTQVSFTGNAGNTNGLRMEYFILEMFFQILAQNPPNSALNSLVSRVVLELCRRSSAFSHAMAIGALVIYQLLPSMDYGSMREYSKWLAFQLLNTPNHTWPYWQHWYEDFSSALAVSNPAADEDHDDISNSTAINMVFCQMAVDKMARVNIPEVIKQSLPESLHSWVNIDRTPKCDLFDIDTMSNVDARNNELMSMAARLKLNLAERQDADSVEEFLDSPNELLDQGDNANIWRGVLLLKTILHIGGPTISIIITLCDKYMNLIRGYLGTEEDQQAMMSDLVETYSGDFGLLHVVLDILLRRGIIEPPTAAAWVMSPNILQDIHLNMWTYSIVEIISDRSIDIVKAAVARRRQFNLDMVMDASVDVEEELRVISEQRAVATAAADAFSDAFESTAVMGNASSSEGGEETRIIGSSLVDEEIEDRDMDEDDNAGKHRRGHRFGDKDYEQQMGVSVVPAFDDDAVVVASGTDYRSAARDGAAGGNEEEEEDSPLAIATEATLLALNNSRKTYRIIVGTLLTSLQAHQNELSVESTLDAWSVAVSSLAKRVLRAFHGAETAYAFNASHPNLTITNTSSSQLADTENAMAITSSVSQLVALSDVLNVRNELAAIGGTDLLALELLNSYIEN